jgi:hypothetical protein
VAYKIKKRAVKRLLAKNTKVFLKDIRFKDKV